jgi:hypothetical protein
MIVNVPAIEIQREVENPLLKNRMTIENIRTNKIEAKAKESSNINSR